MSENSLRKTVVNNLRPFGAIIPVESHITPGFPDYIYCIKGKTGVLELKHIAAWPARSSTPIRISSLTLDQVLWAENWARNGGHYRMLLRVGTVAWFMFGPGRVRALYERRFTRAALPRAALLFSTERRFPTVLMLKILTGG